MVRNRVKKQEGFTLIEIVAVLAIIASIAIVLMPSIDSAVKRVKDTKMVSALVTTDSAIQLYKLEKGSYPASLEVLKSGYLTVKEYNNATDSELNYTSGSDSYSLTGTRINGEIINADGAVVTDSVVNS